RAALRAARRRVRIADLGESRAFAGRRGRHRRVEMSAPLAQALGAEDGSLIELFGRCPAPLRAWVCIAEQSGGDIAVSPSGCAILGVEVGDDVIARALPGVFRVSDVIAA